MQRPFRKHGFTLIECIAAIVVMAISVPPMMWALEGAHRQRVDSTLASTARWMVTEKLEDVLADANSSSRGYTYINASNYGNESSISGFAAFSRSVSIAETGSDLASAGTGYKRVTVSVSWLDGRRVARTLSVATVVTDQTQP